MTGSQSGSVSRSPFYKRRYYAFGDEYNDTVPPMPTNEGGIAYIKNKARRTLTILSPGGHETELQTAMFSKRTSRVNAINGVATPSVDGAAVTYLHNAGSTPAALSVASTNFYTSAAKFRCSTTATAGVGCGMRDSSAQWMLSNVAGMGGFLFVARLGLGAITATNRLFVGMSATTAVLSPTVDPSTLFNQIGFGADAAHTTWRFMCNDGSGTSTMVDLGANFRAQTAATDFYEFRLFAQAGMQKVDWCATRLNDGAFAPGAAVADLPAAGTLLCRHVHHSNGTTAAVASCDIQSVYTETDL